MDAIKLMNRQDTKYVFSENKLPEVLKGLIEHYNILEIDDNRQMTYSNVYFDTKDFKFYHNHHSGKLNRFKIRNRAYVESEIAFCELKFKSNKKRTDKKRIKLGELENKIKEKSGSFLTDISPVPPDELEAKLYMDFNRITLANKKFDDRCTIDFNVVAYNNENKYEFKNLVIAEIKQPKFNAQSPFNQVLKANKVYPDGFSKYCIGIASTYKDIKQNRFKPKFLNLNKITNGTA